MARKSNIKVHVLLSNNTYSNIFLNGKLDLFCKYCFKNLTNNKQFPEPYSLLVTCKIMANAENKSFVTAVTKF